MRAHSIFNEFELKIEKKMQQKKKKFKPLSFIRF